MMAHGVEKPRDVAGGLLIVAIGPFPTVVPPAAIPGGEVGVGGPAGAHSGLNGPLRWKLMPMDGRFRPLTPR